MSHNKHAQKLPQIAYVTLAFFVVGPHAPPFVALLLAATIGTWAAYAVCMSVLGPS